MRTVGVEEELLLMDAREDRTRPVATRVLAMAARCGDAVGEDPGGEERGYSCPGALVHELQEDQIEAYTAPHRAMATLEEELRSWRTRVDSAARQVGARVVASATSPVAVEPRLVPTPRYREMAERFAIVTREQLVCGCHVHVAVTSPEEAVGVLDRIRVWLPPLLALSANSPYWQGRDTGFASFRWQAQGRWPVSGPPEVFGTAEGYRTLVDGMLASEVILDEAMLYLDARCSKRYPTVEIRVADVCLDVRDTVLVAALVRALVETAAAEWAAGVPVPPVPTALIRLATWQAARWGVGGNLLDPVTSRPRPARGVVTELVDHVRPALRACHDEALVTERVERVFARGTGATRQRQAFARAGRLADVVDALARGTLGQADRSPA